MNTAAPVIPPEPEPSLDDLAQRVQTDRDAFAGLYDRYYPRILRYCLRRLFCRSVAEDLTSDIFLTAATKIDTFRGHSEGEFAQWLYTIATNRINAYLRSFDRRRKLLQSAAEEQRQRADAARDADDRPDWPELYEAVLSLKPRDQALIALRFMQDLPHEQIAAILNLRPGAVRVAIGRALNKLRKRFGIRHNPPKEAKP
ncbi:MAG: sigma-70 family RNA polymerase sigma factor [Phycisphaera sp.]|nr:sigma-70 family RNA polymerase sigma factor [Phycisphaera sp.]